MEKYMVYEDDERTALLRKLVREITSDGEVMDGFVNIRHRADLVWWLDQQYRQDESREVQAIDDFTFRYEPDQRIMYIRVHHMLTHVMLVDFAASDDTD